MRKLYAVSSGDYSDWGVEAIFELRETAEAFVSRLVARDREAGLSLIGRQEWALAFPSYIEDRFKVLNDPEWGKGFYDIEEFDYYEGQELPAPGLVTTA